MSAPTGNGNAATHGGAGAVLRLQTGQELVGLAADAERAVYIEIETSGRWVIIMRNAARLQAATDLYWNAITKSAQEGDLDKLDHYVARFGWLAGASLRAWAQVKSESNSDEGATARDVLDALKNERGEK